MEIMKRSLVGFACRAPHCYETCQVTNQSTDKGQSLVFQSEELFTTAANISIRPLDEELPIRIHLFRMPAAPSVLSIGKYKFTDSFPNRIV